MHDQEVKLFTVRRKGVWYAGILENELATGEGPNREDAIEQLGRSLAELVAVQDDWQGHSLRFQLDVYFLYYARWLFRSSRRPQIVRRPLSWLVR